jgi:gluconolactonase
MAWTFEQIGNNFNDVLDGPVWDGGGLLFCKVLTGEVLRWDAKTGDISTFRRFTARTSGLAFGQEGELYAAQSGSRRIAWYQKDGSARALTALLNGARHNHPHHLVVDKQRRIWFSDPYSEIRTRGPQMFPLLEHRSVLRLDYESPPREWVLKRMTFDTNEPRGVALSPDEATLYVAESTSARDGKREVRAYPILETGLGLPRVLHTFGADHRGAHRGAAGICVDSEGNVLVAAGSRENGPGPLIYVFASSGRPLDSHPVPTDRPTACAFGGENLATLFVTTQDGHLFQVRNTNRVGTLPVS